MMSRILKEIHESVTKGYEAGIVNLDTMQKFDKLCMIDSHSMQPQEIQNIRKEIQGMQIRKEQVKLSLGV